MELENILSKAEELHTLLATSNLPTEEYQKLGKYLLLFKADIRSLQSGKNNTHCEQCDGPCLRENIPWDDED